MKLLYFVGPDEVDEVLMVVPDDYDAAYAEAEAEGFVTGAELVREMTILEDRRSDTPAEYRPFVG